MKISFEEVEVQISKDHRGLLKNGLPVGSKTIGRRALLDGLKSPYVFLKAKNSNHGCEATIGENCILLSKEDN